MASGSALTAPRARTTVRVATLWVGLGLLAAAGGHQLMAAFREGLSGGHDFVQDYAAIRAIVEGRNPYEPYNEMTQQLFGGPPHRGNLYSFHAPSSLIFFMPLAPFSYTVAFVAWGLASLTCLGVACWLILQMLGVRRAAAVGALGAFALILLPPIRENFVEGQLNVVVTAGMVAMWAAYREGRTLPAGLLLGAAFALKPIPGLFFVYFLWRRKWRLLAGAVTTLAAFNLVGLALAGWEGVVLYATVNYPDHANVWPAYPDNASIRGLFARLFGPSAWRRPPYPAPGAAMAAWALGGAVLMGLLWLAARRPAPSGASRDLELGALLGLTLLVTPIVWPHYYVVVVPTVLLVAGWLWHGATNGGRWERFGLFALATVSAGLATAHYVEPYRGVGGQQLALLVVLYALTIGVLGRSSQIQRVGTSPAEIK